MSTAGFALEESSAIDFVPAARNSYWYGFSFDVLGRVLEVVEKKRLDKAWASNHCASRHGRGV